MLSDSICNYGPIISRFYNFLENEDNLHLLCDKLAEEKKRKSQMERGNAKRQKKEKPLKRKMVTKGKVKIIRVTSKHLQGKKERESPTMRKEINAVCGG